MGVVYGPISPFKNATFYRDFAKYQTLNHLIGPNITYSNNNSCGSYIGSDGHIKYKGTNLFLNSENFSANTWTKQNDITLISNIIDPPAAFVNTYKNKPSLITQATSSITYMFNTTPISFTDSFKQFTFSIFIKSNTSVVASAGKPLLRVRDTTSGNTLFDADIGWTLTSGILVPSISSSSNLSYSNIQTYENGWYRISIGGDTNSANIQVRIYPNNTAAAGEIGKGYYIWAAQLVQYPRECEYSPNTSEISISPRFTYDPVSKKSLGLLVEKSGANALSYSEDFSNVFWNKNNSTITSNTTDTLAPDGYYTADILRETTADNDHFIIGNTNFATSPNVTTFSVYAKARERSIIRMRLLNTGMQFSSTYFDLNNKTIYNLSNTTNRSISVIKDVGSGWYRCSTSAIASNSTGTAQIYVAKVTGSSSYSGDLTGGLGLGIYLWGAQVENSSFATSYIPSDDGSGINRNADNLYITPVNSFMNSNFRGTIYAEFNCPPSGDSGIFSRVYDINNNINDNERISFSLDQSNPSGTRPIQVSCVSSGSSSMTISNLISVDQNVKTVLSIFPNDGTLYVSGLLASSGAPDSSVILPTGLTHFYIGSSRSGNYLNGSIGKIMYSPTRSKDASIQNLTV
jgi:hypothetical protein